MTAQHHKHDVVAPDHPQEAVDGWEAGADGTALQSNGHGGHDHEGHEMPAHVHADHDMASNKMAVSATLHCLTGCAIGEIAGLVIGTAAGLANVPTVAISIALAFVFGYTLSTLPLLKAGLVVGTALSVVLAADTLSIATMEVVDNLTVVVIPGAMNAGLVNATFWISLLVSLMVAFGAAYPVNRFLLQRGKGHALTHEYHGAAARTTGWRRFIPTFRTGALVATILAFILGGLLVSIADSTSTSRSSATPHPRVRLQ